MFFRNFCCYLLGYIDKIVIEDASHATNIMSEYTNFVEMNNKNNLDD